jgi:hypothetical protein
MSRGPVGRMEILLVEDNLEDANTTLQALSQGKVPCRVSLVRDGEEAVRFLHREGVFAQAPTPNLVLLDMQLPKKDGRQRGAWGMPLAEVRVAPNSANSQLIADYCYWLWKGSSQTREVCT